MKLMKKDLRKHANVSRIMIKHNIIMANNVSGYIVPIHNQSAFD